MNTSIIFIFLFIGLVVSLSNCEQLLKSDKKNTYQKLLIEISDIIKNKLDKLESILQDVQDSTSYKRILCKPNNRSYTLADMNTNNILMSQIKIFKEMTDLISKTDSLITHINNKNKYYEKEIAIMKEMDKIIKHFY